MPGAARAVSLLMAGELPLQGPKDGSTAPLELSFMESYGSIAQHLWFDDGYVLVGFRGGQVVVLSSLR